MNTNELINMQDDVDCTTCVDDPDQPECMYCSEEEINGGADEGDGEEETECAADDEYCDDHIAAKERNDVGFLIVTGVYLVVILALVLYCRSN